MKKVLIIAWYFPPVGGPGTQRTSKYCKYLPKYGWTPVVIGGVDPGEHQDWTLLKDIPENTEIYRIESPHTKWFKIRKWLYEHRLGRIGTWIGYFKDFPDLRRDWAEACADKAIELYSENPFDAVYTTSYPYSAHYAGLKIKEKLNIPWIADLRDPWADNEIMLGNLPEWMRIKHRKAEKIIADKADAITFAHPENAKNFQKQYNLKSEKCICITNGFDPDDYCNFPSVPPVKNGVINMTHTGSFYGAYSPQALKNALEKHWRQPPFPVKELHLNFIGGIGSASFPELEGIKIKVKPRVSHPEALKAQAESHILFTVFDRRTGSSNVSGKLFEYLASGRPVFGILPEHGTMADIIRECKAGWVADCDKPLEIIEKLHKAMSDIYHGNQTAYPDKNMIAKYSRPVLAKKLAGLLNEYSPDKIR